MDVGRFRAVLRERRETLVGSQAKLSELTRKTAADVAVNAMTISEIETGAINDPRLSTVVRLVEAMPGLTLAEFFARVEGLSEDDVIADNARPPAAEDPDEGLPAFDSEDRIAARVVRLLTRYAIKGFEKSPTQRPAHHRLPAGARPLAAERSPHDRARRRRGVQESKKKRPPKKK